MGRRPGKFGMHQLNDSTVEKRENLKRTGIH